MRQSLLLFATIAASFAATAQTQRYAQSSGDWNSVTWTEDQAGTIPAAVPTNINDVYTNGQSINITGTSVTIRNLAVSAGVAGSLNWTGAGTLTIRGGLVSWDDAGASPSPPTQALFSGVSRVTLTAADQSALGDIWLFNNEVMGYWNETAPITNLTIALSNDAFLDADYGSEIRVTSQLQISGSGRTLQTGFNTGGIQVTNAFVVATGATFITSAPIRATSLATSRISNVNISGELATSSFVNATNFSVGSSGVLRTSFNGADQTQGWWYQSTNPTGGSINASSTISFEADADQIIPARTYGNLILNASSVVNKTLTSGTLNVSRDFTVNSASVVFNSNAATGINIGGNLVLEGDWSPTDVITFNGSGAQAIGGAGLTSFGGGITLNKGAGTLSLNKNATMNGINITQGTFSLGSFNVTMNSGSVANSGGSITYDGGSASTLIIDGNISMSGNVTFNNVTINSTRTLTSTTGTLSVGGNLVNNGTFNANDGTLRFNGINDQTISGSLTLNNLTIDNTSTNGVAVGGTVNLAGQFTLAAGKFDADGAGSGTFVLLSTGLSGGGRIGELIQPDNFSGAVTVQRYLDGPENYRYLSFPVVSPNLGMWKNDNAINGIPITGNFSDPSPVGPSSGNKAEIVSSSAASVFYYDGPTQSYVNVANPGNSVSANNAQITNTRGYVAWTYINNSTVLNMTGSIGKGDINIPLSASGAGWNLVPNPYPSAIDWDEIVNTSGTSNTVYFTTAQGSFATYVEGSPCTGCGFNSAWTGEIAKGQSFWIESTGATTLQLTEAAKINNSAIFVREEMPRDYFRVTLLASASGMDDDLIIRFEKSATDDLDVNKDARKKKNEQYINLSSYTTDANLDFAINVIPYITCSGTVKLKVTDVAEGNYTLKFSDFENLTTGYVIKLRDNFTQQELVVDSESEYAFAVTADPLTYGTDRFEVMISSPMVETTRDLRLASTQECDRQFVEVTIANSQPGINYLFKTGDSSLHEPVLGNGGEVRASILKSSLAVGTNKLSLVASSFDGCDAHVFSELITINYEDLKEITEVTSGRTCGEGTVVLSAQGGSENGSYRWYESLTAPSFLEQTESNAFTTPILTETKTYFVTAVNGSGCESLTREAVTAEVVMLEPPAITVTGNVLSFESGSGSPIIQWYKNGEPINGANGITHEATSSGSYSVSLELNGCTVTSAGREFLVSSVEEARKHGYTVYPNPVDGQLSVSGPGINGPLSVELYDAKGRKLTVNWEREGDNLISASFDSYKKGVYLLNIREKERFIQIKVIKK